jgi:peptide/nickel transport system substrate-binding protein
MIEMTLRVMRSALTAGVICGLAACGDGPTPGEGPADAQVGGQAILAESADLSKPNPLVNESVLDNQVNGMIYMSILGSAWENGELLYQTADEDPTALARSYEFFGPDSASLRYHLRSDVRWTDGQPVTARDAAWTLEVQGMPEVASPRQDYNREIREIVAEDDSTLVIHFTRRYPEMFFHTAGAVVPRHLYEGSDLSQMRSHPTLTDPVGSLVTNGPYRLAQWTRGQSVVLERNPDFEPRPNLDRIVFRIIPEETTRMIELQTGNVDMTQVPFHYLDEIRAADILRIETQEKRSYEYIAYNPDAHAFLADRDIRRALGMAIDGEGLIAALQMEDFAVRAGGPYPPIFRRLYDPEDQAPLPFDTVQAKRILAEKGWRPDPDGILVRDGVPLRFTLLTNAENRRRVDVAQIVQRQWRQVGIDARIQTLEFNTTIERTTGGEYDAYIGGWNVGLSADLYQLWGNPDLPFNFVGYDNPEVQRLFEEAVGQPTEEDAAEYWRRAASLIVADQPYTWLYYYDTPFGINNRLRGTVVNTLGQYQRVWEWYIEE